jgi:hypothetical protein
MCRRLSMLGVEELFMMTKRQADWERAAALADKLAVATAGTEAHALALRLRKLLEPPPSMAEILSRVPGETHRDRAREIGCSFECYYNWLREEVRPNNIFAQRLAEITGFSEDVIRGR